MQILALSSGEAELCVVSKAGEQALGIRAILADFGVEVKLELHSDATAAIGMCRRLGLGRVRHLAVADLWIQQKVRDGDLSLFKVPGKQNIADIVTKYRSARDAFALLVQAGNFLAPGRPASAPTRTTYVIGANKEVPPGFAHLPVGETAAVGCIAV